MDEKCFWLGPYLLTLSGFLAQRVKTAQNNSLESQMMLTHSFTHVLIHSYNTPSRPLSNITVPHTHKFIQMAKTCHFTNQESEARETDKVALVCKDSNVRSRSRIQFFKLLAKFLCYGVPSTINK